MSTARMTARFDGTCPACKKPTVKGSTIEYDYTIKKAFHPECAPGIGNPREPSDQPDSPIALAERLGYRPVKL